MYFKLAFKNVRKSFKDYTLYFITLTFGVCIFYIFNSIEAQKAMMNISESTSQMMGSLTKMMGIISVFVSIVLGFLIVYANNFLIRRRKKEMGIYMTLGMEKGKVAKLLVSETFTIGMLSLGVGLLIGVFMSQCLSVVTAKLFQVDMTGYRFIFSSSAFIKTIIYFGVIFFIVMVMSTISISKYKLIDLINAEKQNEKQKLKNPVLIIILFILSIACICTAYKLVLKNGIMSIDQWFAVEIILGIIGTFLFFASLSGFFLKILQSNKKRYLKKLNMFILRQINSRINTAHISISFVCLMIFFTIGILSTALGINNAINKSFSDCAPYDASFKSPGDENIAEKLKSYGFNLNDYTDKYKELSVYQCKEGEQLTTKTIFDKVKEDISAKDAPMLYSQSPIYFLKLSEYNELMKLQGKNGIILNENQVAIYSEQAAAMEDFKKILSKFVEKKNTVKISAKDYEVYTELLMDGIETTVGGDIVLALVVPDKMAEGNQVHEKLLSFNWKGNGIAMEKKFETDIYALADKYKDKKDEIKITGITKRMIKALSAGSTAIISFVGIYLGIIFLITSSAILALQQLSEVADNRHRYDILKKIGADNNLISSALFKQIAIYFMVPLALAIIHSIVGIKVANESIQAVGKINVTGNIIITAALIVAVYGSYFLATYFSCKKILKV